MSDDNSTAMREMRRQFVKLIAESPEAFHACVAEYQKFGARHFKPLDDVLRKNRVPQSVLVMLLADYRARPPGMSKDDFCAAMAANCAQWGDRFSGSSWHTASAVEKQLKRAMREEKKDPGFAAGVKYTTMVFRRIAQNGSEIMWGKVRTKLYPDRILDI